MPVLQALFIQKPQSLQVVGLSLDDPSDKDVQGFLQRNNIQYPNAFANTKVMQAYGTDIGLPISVLIDGEGIVRSVHFGVLREADIPKFLDHLGPVHATGMAATGEDFAQFEKRGGTDTGRILGTSDKEMSKIGPVPAGCGENVSRLCSRPCSRFRTVGPPQPSDSASPGPIFARNAIHPCSVNRP